MKIVVVSYDELNKCPDSSKVLEDLYTFYCEASQDTLAELGSDLRKKLGGLKTEAQSISFVGTSGEKDRINLMSNIAESEPDLVVSYNLAGFEATTLTDGLGYNLLDCRQVHFICNNNLPNQKLFDAKEKSINLFFVHNI